MLIQIRIMTIKDGRLDDFVKLYDEVLEPIMHDLGLRNFPRFVNRPRSEFFWIRAFNDEEHMREQRALYSGAEARNALGSIPHDHVEKVEDFYLTLSGGENLEALVVAERLWGAGSGKE
jgi:hypothetical protein